MVVICKLSCTASFCERDEKILNVEHPLMDAAHKAVA